MLTPNQANPLSDLDAKACRRLVTAVLLSACLDAGDGDATAWKWICGPAAAHLADLVDFGEVWPPRPAHLGSQREIKARALAKSNGRASPTEGQAGAQLRLFCFQDCPRGKGA